MKPFVFLPTRIVGRPFAAIAALAAAFPSAVLAQTNQDRTLAPVVVTATRVPQIASDVLSDTTVITSEDIARSGHASLVNLLQSQRGIEVARNGGPGTNASVFIRGAENKQNIVLVDGVRIGSSTTGGANWSAIPLSQIDRVEIVYGPLSTLYGSDAIGGVVQIFTKKGEGAPAPTVSFGLGTYRTRNLEAGVSGAALPDGRLRYALRAAHEKSEGFSARKPGSTGFNPDDDGYERNSAGGQLGFEIAKGHDLSVAFLKSHLNSEFDASARLNDRLVQDVESYSLSSSNKILPGWTSRIRLGRSVDDVTNKSTSISRFDTTQDHLSWQNDVTVGGADLLQLIAERREEQVESTTAALNRGRTTNSVAAAYQLHRGLHLGSMAVRNDDSSQFGSHTTGSVGYGYRFSKALRANASYGTSFRAPTFNELYFPGFGVASNQPEKGRNAEVGLYYADGTSQASATYYRNRIRDLIVTAVPCPAGTGSFPFGCAFNVNEATLTGISLGANTRTGNLTWRSALDLQDPRDDTTDKRLARRAKYHGTLGAEYGASATRAGAEVVFSGNRFDDAANRNRLGGYGLLNLYASYDFAPNWTLFGRWNNVLDKDYELARSFRTEGSNLFAGVRYGMR